jgi:prepilin-type N-terminal cleavage/methylation domain-containing protein
MAFAVKDSKPYWGGKILMPSKKSKGFTLVEVLVSLVILSIALLALAGLMVSTTRNNASGGHLTEAATFAQDILERLRVSPLTSIPTGVMIQNTCVGSTGIIYTGNWSAVKTSATLDTITITVSWVDPAKLQPHSISMISTFSE